MIFYVSGNKDGVGKSLVASALIDALISKSCELILVDPASSAIRERRQMELFMATGYPDHSTF